MELSDIAQTKMVDGKEVKISEKERKEILKQKKSDQPTLSKAKQTRIDSIKERANSVLSETDWYVVRKQETGESIPQSVVDHRAKVRSLSDQFESDVTALESVSEVQEYSFEYPEPPKP